LVKKLKKCQKTAILDQKTIKNDISDLATRKFEQKKTLLSTELMHDFARMELPQQLRFEIITSFSSRKIIENQFKVKLPDYATKEGEWQKWWVTKGIS